MLDVAMLIAMVLGYGLIFVLIAWCQSQLNAKE